MRSGSSPTFFSLNSDKYQRMGSLNGSNTIEYGGEYPWVHVWNGEIPDTTKITALELSDTDGVKEKVKFEVNRLMTFSLQTVQFHQNVHLVILNGK